MSRFWNAAFTLWLVSILVLLLGMPWMVWFAPMEPNYHYEVKTQQAFDVDRVEDEDVTEIENLSADEKDVLYRAFKKEDHFMGSSKSWVYPDERLETFRGWRLVEVKGVVLLVAVVEHTDEQPDKSIPWVRHVMNLILASAVYFVAGMMAVMMMPPRY